MMPLASNIALAIYEEIGDMKEYGKGPKKLVMNWDTWKLIALDPEVLVYQGVPVVIDNLFSDGYFRLDEEY